MTEAYSDIWKRQFLEQHPEKATEQQARRCAEPERPTTRTVYPFPTIAETATFPPSEPCPTPDSPRLAQHAPPSWPPAHVAPASSSHHPATHHSASALVRAACELRHRLRLTQRAFAEQLGINPRTWQEWEQGRRLPTGPGRALLEQWLKQHDLSLATPTTPG